MTTLFALLLSSAALAGGDCPSLAEVSARIAFCSHNHVAVEQGQACAGRIRAGWVKASQDVAKTLAELKRASKDRQQSQLATSRAGYAETLKKLNRQITDMQRDTALVASYAQAMLDFPDSNEDEPPATCFTESFDKLQAIVGGLDKDIVQAKGVYKETLALRKAANTGTVDMSSVRGSPPDLPKRPAAGALPAKTPRDRESDVSGTKEDAAKRARERPGG